MTSFAVAGAGWMANVHALALVAAGPRVGSCDLTVVASRGPERANELAQRYGASVVDVSDLPSGADIVLVATPPGDHLRPALHAAAGGAAVVVEKPLCTTLADADRLVRVAEAGAAISYGENLLFSPPVILALRDIAGLGKLGHLSVKIGQRAPNWGNFLQRSAGGGVMLDLGVHALALVLRAVMSDTPVSVRGVLEFADDGEVEDRGHATIEFASGLSATVDVSWRETTPDWHLQAAAENGVVRLELMPEVRLERSGEPVELPPTPEGDEGRLRDFGYVDQICEAVYAFRAERGIATSTAGFGRDILDIVCAVSASAASGGEAVPLPYDGPRDQSPIEIIRPNRS